MLPLGSNEPRADADGGNPILQIQIDEDLGPLSNWTTLTYLVAIQGFLYRVYGCLEATLLQVSFCNL